MVVPVEENVPIAICTSWKAWKTLFEESVVLLVPAADATIIVVEAVPLPSCAFAVPAPAEAHDAFTNTRPRGPPLMMKVEVPVPEVG